MWGFFWLSAALPLPWDSCRKVLRSLVLIQIARGWKPRGNFQEQVVSAFSKGRLCQCWGIQRCGSCIAANLHGQVFPAACVVSHASLWGYSRTQENNLQVCMLRKLEFYFFRIPAKWQKVVPAGQGKRIKIILNYFRKPTRVPVFQPVTSKVSYTAWGVCPTGCCRAGAAEPWCLIRHAANHKELLSEKERWQQMTCVQCQQWKKWGGRGMCISSLFFSAK